MSSPSSNINGVGFLFLLFCLMFASCEDDEKVQDAGDIVYEEPFVVFLKDLNDDISVDLSKEIERAFLQAKIPFQTVNVDAFNKDPDLFRSTKVIYINSTQPLDSIAKISLIDFTAEGGQLILTNLNEDRSMDFLMGIRLGAEYTFETQGRGIQFKKNVLPDLAGRKLYENQSLISLSAENFTDDIEVLASSINNDDPIIYARNIGNGRLVHFNTFKKFEKQDRGLFFSLALPGLQALPFPIANVSAIQIDDFPNPVFETLAEPIQSEMGITMAEFVSDVWWPDMLRVANRFNIQYTVFPCFNYDKILEPPFVFREWDLHQSMKEGKRVITTNWLMDEVRENDFEMAFHGYNHEHLTKEVWKNTENIEDALIAVRKKWKVNRFGAYPTSYVPPSNLIDSTGLRHLHIAMPEILYLASTFGGVRSQGGDRDFGPDPYVPEIYDFPRVTSGYVPTDLTNYIRESVYLYSGVWTHFIHPDDIFQLPDSNNLSVGNYNYRNPQRLNWYKNAGEKEGMFALWVDFLSKVKRLHPSSRFLKTTQAATITKSLSQTSYVHEETGDAYSIEKISENQWLDDAYYWRLYMQQENELRLQNLLDQQRLIYTKTPILDGSLFVVTTDEPFLRFPENTDVITAPKYYTPEVSDLILAQYVQFEKDKVFFLNNNDATYAEVESGKLIIEDSVAWFVANEDLVGATSLLQKKLENADSIDIETFEFYVQYLFFDERQDEIWAYLDDTYQNKSHELAFTYLHWYLERESYPNEQLNELWLRRQLLDAPGNKSLLDEYLLYFYNADNQINVKNVVVRYHLATGTGASYALYIKYLIDFEQANLTEELKGKQPKDHPLLRPYATTITYAFADKGLIESALLWSDYSKEIDIRTQLQWWIDLEAYNKMERVYLNYIEQNPSDEATKSFVSNFWFDIGEVERSALVAKSFQQDATLDKMRTRIDEFARFFEADVQKYLIERTPVALSPDTLQMIKTNLRNKSHDYISFNTSYVEDNFDQSVWNNQMSYHKRTKDLNEHRLSITYSDVSDINLNYPDVSNVPHSLYGLQYTYQTKPNTEKPVLYGTVGLEQDDSGSFFTFGAGYAKSDSIKYFSIAYEFSPVRTGPAISQQIYSGELVGYYERGVKKHWQTTISPVLSHYTFNSGVFEAALTGKLNYNFNPLAKSRFSPYVEGLISTANANIEDGNPFWIVTGRYYAGGGLSWNLGNQLIDQIYLRADAGAFFDSYTGPFIRLTGSFAFPIKRHLYLNGQFEYFNQDLYYSNGFRFGISYFLDRRKPYTYKSRPYDSYYR